MASLDDVWRKSRRSLENGNCVELRAVDGRVQVRDSADPGPFLTFEKAQFAAFLAAVANREFDRP